MIFPTRSITKREKFFEFMKKEIYITALHLAHGGVEMAISLLSRAFSKRGYKVTILSLYRLGDPAYPMPEEVKIEYLTDLKPNKEEFFSAIKSKNPFHILKEGLYSVKVLKTKKTALIRRLKKIESGTVISTRNEHSTLLSKYANKNVFKIAQLHHDHLFDKKLMRDFKNGYQNIDVFTLLTDMLTEEVGEMMKEKNSKTRLVTIENFITEKPSPLPFEEKEKVVLAVGRLSHEKGFDRLLAIWKEFSEKHPDWVLHLVGDGAEKQALFDYAKKLKLDSVIFTGALPHEKVLDEMRKASIYAMTSRSEGFPFVMLEALFCGLPTVAFDVRVAPRAIIQNGESGFLVPDGEISSFASSLSELAEKEEKRKIMSENSLKRAEDFTEEKIIEKWLAILP